jgi:regulator of PEP synthase PpsR (kinase-PPPase family)
MTRNYFHLHLVSDSTGETLIAVSRAVVAQYQGTVSIEHVYPLVRNADQLTRVINEIQSAPGIVLYTLVDQALSDELQAACREFGAVSLSVLEPILNLFQSYLGPTQSARPGAQHTLNSEYFRRIDALNYTMAHDDGQMADDFESADVVLLGVSRTSKTPTSIYLANRGIKTANLPLVPGVPIPEDVYRLKRPLVVGLFASPERIVQIRENRLLSLNASDNTSYVDRQMVSDEINQSKRLFNERRWPMIDVTRRSIEETAAAIMDLHRMHQLKFIAD